MLRMLDIVMLSLERLTMDNIDKEAMIKNFTNLINEGLIIDIETGIRPCIERGEMVTEQIIITYRVKNGPEPRR